MFYTLLSSINLSGVTCTFVGATSMSDFSSTMFTACSNQTMVHGFMLLHTWYQFIECMVFSHLDQHQSLSSLALTSSYDGMLSHSQHTALSRMNHECVYVCLIGLVRVLSFPSTTRTHSLMIHCPLNVCKTNLVTLCTRSQVVPNSGMWHHQSDIYYI